MVCVGVCMWLKWDLNLPDAGEMGHEGSESVQERKQ